MSADSETDEIQSSGGEGGQGDAEINEGGNGIRSSGGEGSQGDAEINEVGNASGDGEGSQGSRGDPPQILTELYDPLTKDMNYIELLDKCEETFRKIRITPEEAAVVEESTRGQADSTDWFEHRKGRITASKFRSAVKTNKYKPAVSLIKGLCNREDRRLSTAEDRPLSTEALRWGTEHEKDALECYRRDFSCNGTVGKSGFRIDTERPYLGASPDGIVECECHGKGVVEVKCPYKYRHGLLNDFCMETETNWTLKRDHQYYYQVQLQMQVCDVDYCDFFVWTTKDTAYERIRRDQQFIDDCVRDVEHFYKYGVLPELVGKFYTDGAVSENSPDQVDGEAGVCYCNQPRNEDDMIQCSNTDTCAIGWFHRRCLKIEDQPRGKWCCPSCHRLRSQKKRSQTVVTEEEVTEEEM